MSPSLASCPVRQRQRERESGLPGITGIPKRFLVLRCHPDDVAVCDGSRYWECQPHGDGGGTCHVCEANSGVALKRLRSMTMMQLSQFVVMFCLADMIHMINLGCRAGGGL